MGSGALSVIGWSAWPRVRGPVAMIARHVILRLRWARLRGAHDRGRGAVCRVGLLRVWSSVTDVVAMFRPAAGR
jgi:hypothetical protein